MAPDQIRSEKELLWRIRQVAFALDTSESTVRRLLAAGDFPPPVEVGDRSIAFRVSEVKAWVAARPVARSERSVVDAARTAAQARKARRKANATSPDANSGCSSAPAEGGAE